MSSKKERNHHELKEMGNRKKAKIISIAWWETKKRQK